MEVRQSQLLPQNLELTGVNSTGEELGRGAYGIVEKVLVNGKPYAAKSIHGILLDVSSDQFQEMKKKFYNECNICSTFHHPNVVQMIGIYYPPKGSKLPWLVMELMDKSLTNCIKKTKEKPLQPHIKLSILRDIAEGLRYLHDEKHYFHRDLSSNNIMLTKILVAKIGDFGAAKFIPKHNDMTAVHTQIPGTEHFMPPETLFDIPLYSKSVDVFSLACIALHLMSGEWPKPKAQVFYINQNPVVRSEIERRKDYIEAVASEYPLLTKLIEDCLSLKSSERPKIMAVCVKLSHLLTKNEALQNLELTGVESTGEVFGKGAYGNIYKVLVHGEPYAAISIDEVYFEIASDQFEEVRQKFLIECKICSTFRHPNVLQMIGVHYPQAVVKLPWLVMEMMEESLTSCIERTSEEPLQLLDKLSILRDISEGLRYLHDERDSFHRDLSSTNVMLTKMSVAKIGDFGMAHFIPEFNFQTQIPGTKHFMPPEALSDDPQYGKSVDVFSLACIVLHLTSGKWPKPKAQVYYSDRKPIVRTEIERRIDYFDNVSLECPRLKNLIKDSLDVEPNERPKIMEVCIRLSHIITENQVKQKSVSASQAWKFCSIDPAVNVQITAGESGMEALSPITIPQFLRRTVDKASDEKALCWKDNKDAPWQGLTYAAYIKLIYDVAKSFLKLGLEPYHSVAILGFNSVEWFASSMGAVFAGGLSTGIYTTYGPKECHFILENCKANVVVVENQKQLDKILKIRDKLPRLKAIVQYKGELSKNYPDTYTWEKFLELGKDIRDLAIDDVISAQQPNQCAMLVYTSGTTGDPKGVMLSHDNLTWVTEALLDTLGKDKWKFGSERVVSYLPLAHISGMVADMFLLVPVGGTVYFMESNNLKESLVATLKEAKPTFFFGVPSIWEQIKENMEESERSTNWVKSKASSFGKWIGLTGSKNTQKGQPVPWGWTITNKLLFNKIREAVGLLECRQMTVGAAPIHFKTLEFFMSINMPVLEMYGMSECSGPQTLSVQSATQWKAGSCGKSMSGVETKIANPNEHGEGEILLSGRHIFMGYLGLEEKTKETIDEEGWLHSGDIGRIDKDGFLYITGRIKEMIITAGGENVPPVYIEDCIKTEVPFLSNVMLIGDKRKYLTCLLTLKCIINPDTGEAKDDLQPQVIKMFREIGSECTTVSQVIETEDEAVFKAIQDGIDRYNTSHIVSEAQKVQKWTLLDTDFTIPGGELGPTLKLKRPAVVKKYASKIEKLYEE